MRKENVLIQLLRVLPLKQNEGRIEVSRADQSKFGKAMFGTVRSLINNMVVGVTEGYKKDLIIEGVGYKAQMKGRISCLHWASHTILFIRFRRAFKWMFREVRRYQLKELISN